MSETRNTGDDDIEVLDGRDESVAGPGTSWEPRHRFSAWLKFWEVIAAAFLGGVLSLLIAIVAWSLQDKIGQLRDEFSSNENGQAQQQSAINQQRFENDVKLEWVPKLLDPDPAVSEQAQQVIVALLPRDAERIFTELEESLGAAELFEGDQQRQLTAAASDAARAEEAAADWAVVLTTEDDPKEAATAAQQAMDEGFGNVEVILDDDQEYVVALTEIPSAQAAESVQLAAVTLDGQARAEDIGAVEERSVNVPDIVGERPRDALQALRVEGFTMVEVCSGGPESVVDELVTVAGSGTDETIVAGKDGIVISRVAPATPLRLRCSGP